MELPSGKKVYFASDFHLGISDLETSKNRERRLCRWLDEVAKDAHIIYLVGDIFDTWFEYKTVVPKGFTRLLGKLAQLTDSGITIEAFTGNHDLWMFGYFEEELNIKVHRAPIEREFNGVRFIIAHGDGLGPGDNGYKLLKAVMSSKLCQWLYARFHPNFGIGVAGYLSRLGPKHTTAEPEEKFLGEQEWLVQFARNELKTKKVNYFIFGHRHIAKVYPLTEDAQYINLGDWIAYDSYAVFDGTKTELKYYNK